MSDFKDRSTSNTQLEAEANFATDENVLVHQTKMCLSTKKQNSSMIKIILCTLSMYSSNTSGWNITAGLQQLSRTLVVNDDDDDDVGDHESLWFNRWNFVCFSFNVPTWESSPANCFVFLLCGKHNGACEACFTNTTRHAFFIHLYKQKTSATCWKSPVTQSNYNLGETVTLTCVIRVGSSLCHSAHNVKCPFPLLLLFGHIRLTD